MNPCCTYYLALYFAQFCHGRLKMFAPGRWARTKERLGSWQKRFHHGKWGTWITQQEYRLPVVVVDGYGTDVQCFGWLLYNGTSTQVKMAGQFRGKVASQLGREEAAASPERTPANGASRSWRDYYYYSLWNRFQCVLAWCRFRFVLCRWTGIDLGWLIVNEIWIAVWRWNKPVWLASKQHPSFFLSRSLAAKRDQPANINSYALNR